MPLRLSFVSGVPAPLHLLDLGAGSGAPVHIVPLANPSSSQTDPLYFSPPGQGSNEQSHTNWNAPVPAVHFGAASIPGHTFIFARVLIPDGKRYLNIWRARNMESQGTMYCSLEFHGWAMNMFLMVFSKADMRKEFAQE